MILMKKMMPGITAVCKNPPFVQSELSVPPWQHSPAVAAAAGCHSWGPHAAGDTDINTSGVWLSSLHCAMLPSALSSALPASLGVLGLQPWPGSRTPPAFVPVTLGTAEAERDSWNNVCSLGIFNYSCIF